MDLVFDIGSTEITLGLFNGDEIRHHWRVASDPRRTPDEFSVLLRQLLGAQHVSSDGIDRATLASVMPPVAVAVAVACETVLHLEGVMIDARHPLPVRLDVDEPDRVGADRIVNAVAAHRLYGRDTIVVDLGTATTYDCVTAEGVFIGGAIAPGARIAAEQLTARTAKLPRVPLARPEKVIGRRTESCLRSGIFYGAVDAVDGMVRRIREEWGRRDPRVVATGGLSAIIAPHCRTVQHIEPFLTLRGILFAREHLDRYPGETAPPPRPTIDKPAP
ncbi:MAG: type III pantothenate kinase [Gemmatimonadetes bacterium]|nr:type III pantothenate kinase [Gemmatimonadota bacterium]